MQVKLLQEEERLLKAYEANMDKHQKMLLAIKHDKLAGIKERNIDQIGKIDESLLQRV